MISSPIQNNIISALKNGILKRYADLQPKNIPNDLFNYHLQFLVKKGLVDRFEDGYSLSKKGVKYVADVQEEPGITNNHLFKINVLMILSRIENGKLQILQQVRKSNPSFGKIGVPGGVVRRGESLEDAAKRKLKIETGLTADFKILGTLRRFLYVKNELFSDVFFPIAYANKFYGELIKETEYGENKWIGINEAIKNESAEFDSIVYLPKVLMAIKNGEINERPVFYEESTQVGDAI